MTMMTRFEEIKMRARAEKLTATGEPEYTTGYADTLYRVTIRRVTSDGEYMVVREERGRRNSGRAWRKGQRNQPGKPSVKFVVYHRDEYLRLSGTCHTLREARLAIVRDRIRRVS